MLFYLIVALVAAHTRKFKTVFIWGLALQILSVAPLMLSSQAILRATPTAFAIGTIISFLIINIIGASVYLIFKRKAKMLSPETFKKQRKLMTIVLAIAILIALMAQIALFYNSYQNDQKRLQDIQQSMWIEKAPDEDSASDFAYIVPAPDTYEPDFAKVLVRNNVSFKEMCAFHNGAPLEYIVYNLSSPRKRDAVAYVTQECIAMGPMAGQCNTYVALYSPPALFSESDCVAFIKKKAGDDFRFYEAGHVQR